MPPLTTMAQHYNNTATTSRAVHIHSHVHYSLSEYTREDNICASACVVGIVFNSGQHRRRRPRLFAIDYFNENTVYIHNICF